MKLNGNKAQNFLLDIFFPIECLGCGKEDVWLCEQCLATIPLNTSDECPRCHNFSQGSQTCLKCQRGYYLNGVLTASHYDHPIVRKLVTNLKYNYVKVLVEPLAQAMVKQLRFRSGFLEENWLMVPVPLHRKRLLERGFNQSELLASCLQKLTGMSWMAALRRRFWTPPQAELTGTDRLINIKGVFEADKKLIKNKKIILIDDVFTTGGTLNECAFALRQGGAKEVWGLVAARG